MKIKLTLAASPTDHLKASTKVSDLLREAGSEVVIARSIDKVRQMGRGVNFVLALSSNGKFVTIKTGDREQWNVKKEIGLKMTLDQVRKAFLKEHKNLFDKNAGQWLF